MPDTAKRESNDDMWGDQPGIVSKHHENCKMANAIPPSPLMISNGNDYYTCSNCGEKVARSIVPTLHPIDSEQLRADREQYAYEYAKKLVGDYERTLKARPPFIRNAFRNELHNRNDQLRGRL